MRTRSFAFAIASIALGCSSSSSSGAGPSLDGGDQSDTSASFDVGTFDAPAFDVPPATDTGGSQPARVYANTDHALYKMDPNTKDVTEIGTFVEADGTTTLADVMTDVAVNATGDVWGCSTGKIFSLAIPASESGNVAATQRATLTGARMYALAFAPAGILGSGEELVGGDAAGDVYWIQADGTTTKVGNFGLVVAGDPGLGAPGDTWELSGDIAFFSNDGDPVGIATVRPCTTPGDTASCKNGNDVVVQIDVDALKTKSATASLKKGFLGTKGTNFGHLYGLGAWESSAFAFQRVSTSGGQTTALFVEVSLADGTGTVVKDFPDVAAAADGWSGAGVTTSAKISIIH